MWSIFDWSAWYLELFLDVPEAARTFVGESHEAADISGLIACPKTNAMPAADYDKGRVILSSFCLSTPTNPRDGARAVRGGEGGG
jgi:hypothetical protein